MRHTKDAWKNLPVKDSDGRLDVLRREPPLDLQVHRAERLEGLITRGLSGSTLKIIAVTTMLIDHVAATVLAKILIWANREGAVFVGEGLRREGGATGAWLANLLESGNLPGIYQWMRSIGRLAFPIFCFLLVEGFLHTRDRKKYVFRMGIFALMSEVPFDLAFSGRILEFGYQNVYFTLFLGLLTMLLYSKIEEYAQNSSAMYVLAKFAVIFVGMEMAGLLRTDYGALGIICIMVPYVFRQNRKTQLLAGAISFCWEPPAMFAFLPLAFYNGTRGIRLKYIFYVFYPAHLLLCYLICRSVGIAGISAL